jgi:hypothetical protein
MTAIMDPSLTSMPLHIKCAYTAWSTRSSLFTSKIYKHFLNTA